MATVLEPVRVGARRVSVGRVVLLLVAAVLFALGWVAGKTVTVAVWCAVAVRVGWQDARKAQRRGSAR
jgi:hypothetical protein